MVVCRFALKAHCQPSSPVLWFFWFLKAMGFKERHVMDVSLIKAVRTPWAG